MNKKYIRDIDVENRTALVRVDFNVPIKEGVIQDTTRIDAALPTIQLLLSSGAKVVLMSHLGRPNGTPNEKFTLKPVATKLEELLGRNVTFLAEPLGEKVKASIEQLPAGSVVLLENIRFYPGEEAKVSQGEAESDDMFETRKQKAKSDQKNFAALLGTLGEVYVNDAFGTAHRRHASTAVVTEYISPCVAGLLMEKELKFLGSALSDAPRPFGALLGGAKVSDKVEVIRALLEKVDFLAIGGAMAYTFLRAQGIGTGSSLVEEDKIDLASHLLNEAQTKGVELLLPEDHVIGDAFSAEAQVKIVDKEGIEDGWMALDIGPKTVETYSAKIAEAKTILWNGPMGAFELQPFANGTMSIAKVLAETDCVSIVGGGDSVSAVNKSGLQNKMTHISTGGGASLEFLEGKVLPGVDALDDC